MRHNKLKGKLGRTSSERSSLLANLSISLITHKKIETTYAKAKEVRKYIEKLVTTAKNRLLAAVIKEHTSVIMAVKIIIKQKPYF